MEKLRAGTDLFLPGAKKSTFNNHRIYGLVMQQQASWLSRLWYWRSICSPDEIAAAREAVAHLKPAVVITGGSRGIGLALAQRFMQAGHAVAIVARNAQELDDAAIRLNGAKGAGAIAIVCDITQPQAAEIIASELARAGLYLDLLINNAATGLAGPLLKHTPDELSNLITLNVDSLTRLTRAALPAMIARQQGGVLNVASLGACVPGPYQAAYYASKAYVLSLTEALAAEVAGQGVRVSALLPGPVDTRFHKDMGAEGTLYRLLLPSMTPERVARGAYLGFRLRQQVIVPGLVNKVLYLALRFLPRFVTVPFVALLLKRSQS
jgi:short-subunit dehydrogenase